MRRLVAVLLALALGAGGAIAVASTSGAVSVTQGVAKHRAAAAKRGRPSACAKRERARLRRCRRSYRMSAKRLRPLKGPASAAAPGAGMPSTATPSAPSTTTPATPLAPPPPPQVLSTLGANAFDMGGFVLRLTKTTVPAGDLTVFFTNHDVSDHNLWIEGPGGGLAQISDAIGLNASANKTVAVTAGTWRLFCSLPEHDAMTRDLTVTP